jgi:Mn-dependent DtxR family transcriptional regulator
MSCPIIKSVERIFEYIKENSPVTPSQIFQNMGIGFNSIKEAITFLERHGHIRVISNGKITLLEVIENGK